MANWDLDQPSPSAAPAPAAATPTGGNWTMAAPTAGAATPGAASPIATNATPLQAALDPTTVPPGQTPPAPFGMPVLQNIMAGVVEGQRRTAMAMDRISNYVDQQYPWLGDVDRAVAKSQVGRFLFGNTDPETNLQTLQAQQQAYQRQGYPETWTAPVADIGSNLLTAAKMTGPAESLLAGPVEAVGSIPGSTNALMQNAPAIAGGAIRGAIGGAGASVTGSGANQNQNLAQAAEAGGIGGSVLGGALPGLGAYLSRPGGQVTSQIADRLGVDLTTGQRAGGWLQWLEDATGMVPGSGSAPKLADQNQQVANVLWRNMGQSGDIQSITTPELNQVRQNLGQLIQNNANRIEVQNSPALENTLNSIQMMANAGGDTTPEANWTRSIINNIQSYMTNPAKGGVPALTGQEFADVIAHNSMLDKAVNMPTGTTNYQLIREYGGDIRQALLDAAQSSPGTQPGALADLGKARYGYKVLKTIEPAIQRTGTTESMSYPQLRQLIERNFNMSQSGPGNDMQDLAVLLKGPLAGLKSSGTAERTLAQRALGLGTTEGAPFILQGLQDPGSVGNWARGAGATYAGNVLLGRALRYGPGMNIAPWQAFTQLTNPLAPRIYGQTVGNALTGQQAPPSGGY